jgi:hypothetical protein
MKKLYFYGYVPKEEEGSQVRSGPRARIEGVAESKEMAEQAAAMRSHDSPDILWFVAEVIETVKAKPIPADIEPIVEAAE